MKKISILFTIILIISFTSVQSAKELLIYADLIDYDSEQNLIAKGNVKIISKTEILTSDLVIIKNKTNQIILPISFQYKDELNNYYYGSSGEFSSDFENDTINDVKITHKVYKYLLAYDSHGFSKRSISLEHKIRQVINKQQYYGFLLDTKKAIQLLYEIKDKEGFTVIVPFKAVRLCEE